MCFSFGSLGCIPLMFLYEHVFSVVTCFVGFMEEDGREDKEVA